MSDDNRHLGPTTPGFPVLDAPRTTDDFNRTIADVFGYVEPRIEETDDWVSMPVRLVYDQAAGWHLQVGPYDLDRADIEVMRRAIAAYDAAVGR